MIRTHLIQRVFIHKSQPVDTSCAYIWPLSKFLWSFGEIHPWCDGRIDHRLQNTMNTIQLFISKYTSTKHLSHFHSNQRTKRRESLIFVCLQKHPGVPILLSESSNFCWEWKLRNEICEFWVHFSMEWLHVATHPTLLWLHISFFLTQLVTKYQNSKFYGLV